MKSYANKGMSKVNSRPKGMGKMYSMKTSVGKGITKTSSGCCVPSSYAQQQRAVERCTAKAVRATSRRSR